MSSSSKSHATTSQAMHQPIEPELYVLDPDGDLTLKIVDGVDSDDEYDLDEIEACDKTNIEDDNKPAAIAEITQQIQSMDFAHDTKPRMVLVKVSKDKVCEASGFFKMMLTGGFAEARLQFSKDYPPVIKLEEIDCAAALAVLNAMHQPRKFKENKKFSYNAFKTLVLLAQQWDCLPHFEREVDTDGICDKILNNLPQKTDEETWLIFRDYLVEIFDMALLVGDHESVKELSWFTIINLKEDTCWSIERSFLPETDTHDILQTIHSQFQHLRKEMLQQIDREVGYLVGRRLPRTHLISAIAQANKNCTNPEGYLVHFNVCRRGLLRCGYYLPLLQAIHYQQGEPQFGGSLKELGVLLKDVQKQAIPDPQANTCMHYGRNTLCLPCHCNLKYQFALLIHDFNNLVKPLCLDCFNKGLRKGCPFRCDCEDHQYDFRVHEDDFNNRRWFSVC